MDRDKDQDKKEQLIYLVRRCFFEGMQLGWASGAKAKDNFPFIGAKGYEFKPSRDLHTRDFSFTNFRLIDYFVVNPESKISCGNTLITHDGNPVWAMQYSGRYEEMAIPFLKSVLFSQYSRCNFSGGRGPNSVIETDGRLEYRNNMAQKDFGYFSGTEEVRIFAPEDEAGHKPYLVIGTHRYSGGLMI